VSTTGAEDGRTFPSRTETGGESTGRLGGVNGK